MDRTLHKDDMQMEISTWKDSLSLSLSLSVCPSFSYTLTRIHNILKWAYIHETTKLKPTVDVQKIKGREFKHITIENHQFTEKGSERERGREETTEKWPETVNKMALVIILQYPCPSVITLNGNELNTPLFWHWVAEWIKRKKNKTEIYVVRNSFQLKGHT